jgi:hypothetical protein
MRTVGASEPGTGQGPALRSAADLPEDRFKNRLNNRLSRTIAFSPPLGWRGRHVIVRKTKLTAGSPYAKHGRPSIEPGICRLVQQQDARKNYIRIVNDTAEHASLAGSAAWAQPRVVSYLVGRLAAVLKRPGNAAAERPISS